MSQGQEKLLKAQIETMIAQDIEIKIMKKLFKDLYTVIEVRRKPKKAPIFSSGEKSLAHEHDLLININKNAENAQFFSKESAACWDILAECDSQHKEKKLTKAHRETLSAQKELISDLDAAITCCFEIVDGEKKYRSRTAESKQFDADLDIMFRLLRVAAAGEKVEACIKVLRELGSPVFCGRF